MPATPVSRKMYLHRTESVTEPAIPRRYDPDFRPSAEYLASLPDMMEAVDAVQGARVPIQQVGVAGFKLPIRFAVADGEPIMLEATVTGTVSLEAELKGINMSRIVRTFYDHRDRVFEPDTLAAILAEYRERIGGFRARLRVTFSYPMLQTSLRSGLEGYQYYRVVYEASMSTAGTVRRFIQFDFAYSSACPCSAELSEHARDTRGVYAIPHSQRSRARLKVELTDGATVSVEDLQRHCLCALQTETQVMVKREDEQAFAEMNGANVKFVEDAARLVYEQLYADPRIHDFEVVCSHMESLHSHDAVSAICKGVPGGFEAEFMDFAGLVY